jgi:hypothetical protein
MDLCALGALHSPGEPIMSQALITLFRTAFAKKAAGTSKVSPSTVRVVSAGELRQVVGGAEETALPGRNW